MPSTLSREKYAVAATEFFEPIVLGDGWVDYVVRREIKRLAKIIKLDICSVYTDFQDFLYDFYPDFSWSETEKDLQALLASPEWMEMAAKVKEARGYDFIAEIQKAIVEFKDEE